MKFHDFSPFYRSNEGIKPKVSGDRLLDNPLVADAQSGASFKFDGSDDVITASSTLGLGPHDWSADLWFKTSSTSSNAPLLTKGAASNYNLNVRLDAGKIKFGLSNSAGADIFDLSTSGDYNDGEWHYLSLVYVSATSGTIYVDGVQDGVTTTLSNLPPAVGSADLNIGKTGWASAYFDGEIRQVRIHNRALTAAEVRASYNGQAVGFEYTGASQTNSVSDSDFSASTAGSLPSNVAAWNGGSDSDVTFTAVTDSYSSSPNSAKLTWDTSSATYVYVNFTTADLSSAGKYYEVSCYAKGTNGRAFKVFPSGYTGYSPSSVEWTLTTSWTRYSQVYKIEDDLVGNVQLFVNGTNADTGELYIDDIVLKQIGCVAEYLPESISSSSWLDSSGNALNGAVSGATATNADNNVPVQDGHLMASKSVADLQSGASFKFDGSDDYVEVTTTSAAVLGDSPFSISFWAKSGSSPAHVDRILEMGNSGGNFITICWATNNKIFYQAFNGSWDTALYTNSDAISSSEFKHFTLVKNGTSATWYINGVADTTQSTGSAADINDVTGKLRFGAALNGANTWPGELRQVRLHNRALSADEVRAAYNGQAVPFEYEGGNQSELLSGTGFEGTYGSGIADGWNKIGSDGTYTEEGSVVHSGSKSQEIALSSETFTIRHDNVTSEVGKAYKATAWVRPTVAMDISVRDYNGAPDVPTTVTCAADTWTQIVHYLVIKTNTVIQLEVYTGTSYTGTIYIDDVSLTKIGCVAEYLPTGINSTRWMDTSGNGLHGTTSTATAVNHKIGSLTLATLSTDAVTFDSASGTTTSSTLDHFEQGTWAPVLSDGTNNATMHANNIGTYTRIGSTVFVNAQVMVSSLGSVSGNVRITGLPYQPATTGTNVRNYWAAASVSHGWNLAVTANQSVGGFLRDNQSYIELRLWDATGGTTELQHSEVTADGELMIHAMYYC